MRREKKKSRLESRGRFRHNLTSSATSAASCPRSQTHIAQRWPSVLPWLSTQSRPPNRVGDRIRLHFRNAETDGRSPLGIDRLAQRLADLAALFTHVKRTVRQPPQVVGASWLYNLDAYRRLFPVPYLAPAHVIGHRFQRMPLWGQFLDRYGETKESMTRPFLERLERQSSLDSLDQCFPFQVLSVEAPVLEFYAFYGIKCTSDR